MSQQQAQEKERQQQFDSINNVGKNVENIAKSNVIISRSKTQQNEQTSNQQSANIKAYGPVLLQPPINENNELKPSTLMQSHSSIGQSKRKYSRCYEQSIVKEYNPSDIRLQEKVHFLQHCLNEYKLQAKSLSSKLKERQAYHKQITNQYDLYISELKQQMANLQTEKQGQSKLIEQCHQKYDFQVNEHQKCLKKLQQQQALIKDLKIQIEPLERAINSTREVSVNLIKENQNLKAQICIEIQKYQILFQDYTELSLRYQQDTKEMFQENRILIKKLDQMDLELKLHQKDKEIQNLLAYEGSIHKRQKELLIMDQSSSSPPSAKFYPQSSNSPYEFYHSSNSPYEFIPRKLNFEDNTGQRSTKKGTAQMRNQNNQSQIIDLQKNKISRLQDQLKQVEKRNKELQTLMVKFMK